jgi:hypothetical protein
MFRFVRWLFLLGVIAALAAFLLTYRLQGRTAAERVCTLARSKPCLHWAARGGAEAEALIARWKALNAPPPPVARAPGPRPRVVDATPEREAPPLDHHSRADREALDRILAQRSSH